MLRMQLLKNHLTYEVDIGIQYPEYMKKCFMDKTNAFFFESS